MKMANRRLYRSFTFIMMKYCWLFFISVAVSAVTEEDGEISALVKSNNTKQDSVTPFSSAHESSSDLLLWPFHNKSDTKNKTDNSCGSHTSCYECTKSTYTCHWCAHDNACHEVGSIHGCLRGVDCANHTKPDRKKEKNETSCAKHTTCTECDLSSYMCHWCGDNACHEIGSIYGCVTGVDCYSNDRCRRKTPEPIHRLVFEQMGFLAILVIVVVGGICCCCSTLGYCVAGGVKGAYDDLANLAAQQSAPSSAPPPPPSTTPEPKRDEEEAAAGTTVDGEQDASPESQDTEEEETSPLIHTEQTNGDYHLMTDHPMSPSSTSHRRRVASRHMDRLFTACTVCYVISLMVIGGFVVGSIRYFPKVPQYNICNDSVAWKSLVDSMTSMKIDATIEILMSIANPNYFDVALDMGKGSFSHDGVFVGTFEIPPSQAKAMSITDMTILAKFTPEKWEALSLTAEYYRGTLVLDIASQASIRIPALANYTFESEVSDMRVHVNDPSLMDRHLCACPQWKDEKNKTPPNLFL